MLFSKILKFFFPPSCVVCETLGQELCDQCVSQLKFIGPSQCTICGIPFGSDCDPHPCAQCLKERPAYDKHVALFSFNESIKKLIHGFKYQGQFWVRQFFSRYLTHWKQKFPDIDLIIPVPLHANRLKKRGFNQSLLLAKEWQKVIKQRLDARSFIRVIDTPSQTGLKRAERKKNLRKAFLVLNPLGIRGKNILLVDDVHTTGITLHSAASVLKRHGAKSVQATTLAIVPFV